MNKNTMMIIAVILIIVAAAGGFYGGMMYQRSQLRTAFGGSMMGGGNSQGFRQFGQNGQNFRPVRGQVLSMSSNSLMVKLADGSTKIVVLSQSTAFVQSTKAAFSDLKTGDTVNVVGIQNSDGSVTAQDVQINPPTQMRFGEVNGQQNVSPTSGAGY